MEKFLGVLFCGGKGSRLGAIGEYVSKPLLPVYDKPAFKFGLEILKASDKVDSIIILTNKDNNSLFRSKGFDTVVQDDSVVKDMYSGWQFVKKKLRTRSHGVLVPSDNISRINIDSLISKFLRGNHDFVFSLKPGIGPAKLRQMGSFDLRSGRFGYKLQKPYRYGVIAPFVIRNSVSVYDDTALFTGSDSGHLIYNGSWDDIGDAESYIKAILRRRRNARKP